MQIKNQIEDQLKNIFFFKAYGITKALKQLILFPYDYYFRMGKSSFPLNIALISTLRCNAKCDMCNVASLINKNQPEMNTEQIKQFIKQLSKKRPSFVISGGEPFTRKDLIEIIREIKNNKMSCGVFTNGLLLNKEKIGQLIESRIDYVAFSLLGTKDIHEDIVKVKNAYKIIIKNIKYFCENKKNTKVIIHCTINEKNINDLNQIVELGKKLKVDGVRFGHISCLTKEDLKKNNELFLKIFPRRRIKTMSYIYEPNINKIVNKMKELKKKYKNFVWFTPQLNYKEVESWYSNKFKSNRSCFFVWRALFINSNGNVYPCENFPDNMGNILEKDLETIWNGNKYVEFRKKIKEHKLFPACVRCCKL